LALLAYRIQSIQVVIEVLTTAGFGGQTDVWRENDVLALLVVLMNLSGVLLVFLALPLFVVPLFQQVFEDRPPRSSSLVDHVVICGYSRQDEVLHAELEAIGIPYLYIDPDPERIIELNKQGIDAIVGEPEHVETLQAANAGAARALVTDINDETNPTILLSAKRIDPDLQTVSVIRDYQVKPYHQYAGADDVVISRQLLGKSLGMRAALSYAEKLQNTIEVESDLRIMELLVEGESELIGQTLREATVLDQLGITVIGAWFGGKFIVSPDPDMTINENTILLIAGERNDFESVKARPILHQGKQPSRVVVCGYGTVGWSVVQTLRDEGVDVDVLDLEDKEGVDIVGSVTDPQTLRTARIEDARAVVLSLNKDTPTIYATLMINQLAPDVEIIARADDPDSVWKLYNAGADFVLSLPTVTGEILASLLIEEVEIVTPDANFEFIRTAVPAFVGQSLGELDVRAETGCTVVGIERNGELKTDIGAEFVIEEGDILIVAGSETSRRRFHQTVA
jgi:Trk K+ transport system NAD-binding subunit